VEGDEKIQSVKVQGVLPHADRHCAVGSTKPRLEICNNICCLLEGDLPHQVHLPQDEDEIDWSVERDDKKKFVLVTLYKAVPMEGVFVWWRRPLMDFPEIEIENESSSASSKSKEFVQAWEEAHRLFREKKKAQVS
jgi:hypothetical protein